MGLKAELTATCDGCGKQMTRLVLLNDDTSQGIMERWGRSGITFATDIWSWCIPDEWLQVRKDKDTGQKWLFFCNDDCYIGWLQGQGRAEEALRLHDGVMSLLIE